MEVKINREIRSYTESMFFGLSMRQFVFSILACAVAVGLYFLLRPYVGMETVSWMCILRRGSLCGAGFYQLSRYDSGAVFVGMAPVGTFGAKTPVLCSYQLLLRSPQKYHCRPRERNAET